MKESYEMKMKRYYERRRKKKEENEKAESRECYPHAGVELLKTGYHKKGMMVSVSR